LRLASRLFLEHARKRVLGVLSRRWIDRLDVPDANVVCEVCSVVAKAPELRRLKARIEDSGKEFVRRVAVGVAIMGVL
jgi:hypothetical protein